MLACKRTVKYDLKKMPKQMTVREMAIKGGKARAKNLTAARRKEIASTAAKARWGTKKRKAA